MKHRPRQPQSTAILRWAAPAAVLALLVLAGLLVPAVLGSHTPARPRLSGYVAGRDSFSSGGAGARALTVYTPPTLVVPPAPPPTVPAPTMPPASAPVAGGGGANVLDNPNNTLPADLDPNRPFGPPIIRTDWVISKDYAAHGGPGQWGAIDFAYWYDRDALGSPVVATHAGTVHLVADDPLFGNWVWVVNDHYTTRYGHARKFLVSEGQAVVRGTVLAEMGSTGQSTGPHVDYQVWVDQVNKNPMDYLK
jgi:murein DD-endopeptidase MepM/ murein hydrolase activator NlpD